MIDAFRNLLDLSVQLANIDHFAGIFFLDISGNGEVVVLLSNFAVGHKAGFVGYISAVRKETDDAINVFGYQVVDVPNLYIHLRSIYEEGVVVALGLLEHQDAGGNPSSKKEVRRQLDDTVDVVVIHQVFADLALSAAAVHDAGEADDGSRAAGVEPTEAVHDKSHIRLGFGRQHAGRGEARVVDEQRVAVARPFDGIGRVGDDRFKGFKTFVQGVEEGVSQTDVELGVADIVQKHVDAAEVVGGQVDLLPVEALADVLLAEDPGKVEQERAGAAGGVVDFVDFAFADQGQAGEQFGNVLRGEELTAAFAGVGGIHGHEEFVGIAKSVNVVVLVAAERHLADAIHEGNQALVAFHDGAAEFIAVDVDVVEETFEVRFAFFALAGGFDVAEDAGEGHVEVEVMRGFLADVMEEFTGEDEETLDLNQIVTGDFSF